jgi:hypothetical protein
MGVQSFAWKWNSGTRTYVVVSPLSVVATICTDIIKMVTAIKLLARGNASTAGVIIVQLRCLDQTRKSATHLISPLISCGTVSSITTCIVFIDTVIM